MTIKASGPISLSDIRAEFGGATPDGLNEYYKGGGLVPSGATGSIPTSGAISLSQFYSAAAVVSGAASFTNSGSFTMPAHNTATITLVGAGGGGGGFDSALGGTNGGSPGDSTVTWDAVVHMRAKSGGGGAAMGDFSGVPQNGANGANGTASGGNVSNTTGGGRGGGLGAIWHGLGGGFADATAGKGGTGGKVVWTGALGAGKVLSFTLANGGAAGGMGQAQAVVITRYPTAGGDATLSITWS